MAKITWTSVGSASRAARGLISLFRTQLTVMADAAKKDRGTLPAVIAVVGDMLRYLGVGTVANNQSVPIQTSAGVSLSTNATVVVAANGTITAVRIPATTYLLRSGVEAPSPQATGTWVDGYTPTIAAGAITAIAGS